MKFWLTIWLTIMLLASAAAGKDYYCVSTTGTKTSGVSTTNINDFGWEDVNCYNSMSVALSQMDRDDGVDEMVVNDGKYTGVSLQMINDDGGFPGNYVVIRARNDGQVTLEGVTNQHGVLEADGSYYFIWRGFVITRHNYVPIWVHNTSHHFKIIRCGVRADPAKTSSVIYIRTGSHHGLIEECYAWGGPTRYIFQASGPGVNTHSIIFRRCVARWDWQAHPDPPACFDNYLAANIHFQNCISIDGLDHRGPTVNQDGTKSFMISNGGIWPGTYFTGCISLHMDGGGGFWLEDCDRQQCTDSGHESPVYIEDCIVWDCIANGESGEPGQDENYWPMPFASFETNPDTSHVFVNHCTFGVSDVGLYDGPANRGGFAFQLRHWDSGDHSSQAFYSFRNNIIAWHQLENDEYVVDYQGEDMLSDHDYNCWYGNIGAGNYRFDLGANSLTTTNPNTSGLTYLPRIEADSALDTLGQDGGRIGAEILYKIGYDGTLYGEDGWNTVTSDTLWPFPYEAQIREHMRECSVPADSAFAGCPAIDGTRGFCAEGQTLTNYIWGYLGNTPSGIDPDASYATLTGSPVVMTIDPDGVDAMATIDVYLYDIGGNGAVVAASDIWLDNDAVTPCATWVADSTSTGGHTTFTATLTGGIADRSIASSSQTAVVVYNTPIDTLDLRFNSPDLDGDGDVDATDFARFAECFNSGCPDVCFSADFDESGGENCVGVADFGIFGTNFNDVCP